LVSLNLAVTPNFGETLIEISEPCGKRSFVGRRLVATPISALVVSCAAGHAVDTRNNTAIDGNNAPLPSKAARTILTATGQVKIVPYPVMTLIWLILFWKIKPAAPSRRTAIADSTGRRPVQGSRLSCDARKPTERVAIPGVRMVQQIDYIFRFGRRGPISGHTPFRELVSSYNLDVNRKPGDDLFSQTGGPPPLLKRHPVRRRYWMVELQRWHDARADIA
jgi:hypothetical protein